MVKASVLELNNRGYYANWIEIEGLMSRNLAYAVVIEVKVTSRRFPG